MAAREAARASANARQAWTVPKPSPCSAPRSFVKVSPEGRRVAEASRWCHAVHAAISGKMPGSMALRMLSHSTDPNMLTMSTSRATRAGISPAAANSSTVPLQWARASHALGTPTPHWCACRK
eukprot:11220571-Lingulodinium_polyedra.AAC.1